jgi:hypothetical protein
VKKKQLLIVCYNASVNHVLKPAFIRQFRKPLTANSHMPCLAMPCRAALIHTCHAVPLPFSDSAMSFVKVRVVAGNIRTANPTLGMLLITTFVQLRVVAGRSRRWAGCPHAVLGRSMLIHTCHAHAALCRGLVKSLSERHGRGMACVKQTRAHCINQMGKTKSKPLATRHGKGMVL